MSSSSFNNPTTARKDRKTEEQAKEDMANFLLYYVDDVDGNIERGNGNRSADPPSAPPAPKVKKPPSTSTKKRKTTNTEELQDSPSRRKSARVAAGVKRPSLPGSDDLGNEQPPAKRAKSSSTSATKTPTAAVRKQTGRFEPISSQLKSVKKTEKHAVVPATNDAPVIETQGDTDVGDDAGNDDASKPDEDGPETAGTSKGKATKKMPPTFKGNPDHMGSSLEKPEDAPNDVHWKCANRNCTSGQTWHNRDGDKSFGRKTISNFLGRNKKETNLIHADVWHNYCRKDYQRSTYRAGIQDAKAKCKYYIDNIEMQLVRIKLWRPQAKFIVQLSKGASARLGKYYKELNKNGDDKPKAKKAVTKTAEVNAKGKEKPMSLEDAFPIEYLVHFEDTFCSEGQSFDDLDAVLAWTKDLVAKGHIESMPPMEFLINKQTDDEETIDPTYNYERWAAYEDGKDFATPNGSESGDEADDEQVGDKGEEAQVGDKGEEAQVGDKGEETEVDDKGEETEVDSTISSEAPQQETDGNGDGLTDDESSDEDDSDSEGPQTPPPPPPKRRLFLAHPGARPLSSTYGATPGSGLASKRKRDVSEDKDSDKSGQSSPSKRQKVGVE